MLKWTLKDTYCKYIDTPLYHFVHAFVIKPNYNYNVRFNPHIVH